MASTYMVVFALALLVALTTALPKVKMDEERTDQDRLVSIAGEDDASEMGPGPLTFRRHSIIEGRLVDEDGTKRIFILAVSSLFYIHSYFRYEIVFANIYMHFKSGNCTSLILLVWCNSEDLSMGIKRAFSIQG